MKTSGLGLDLGIDWLLGGLSGEMRPEGREYGTHGIFVPGPGLVNDRNGDDIMVALLYAARGCGVEVYTDEVYITEGHWARFVPTGVSAVDACIGAVQYAIDSAELSGCGALHYAYFVFGLHDVMSVAGHTDEGAGMRDVFRAMPTTVPCGILAGVVKQHVRMPMPAVGGRSFIAFAGGVDAMLLASAALCAVSDPGSGDRPDVPITCYRGPSGPWTDMALPFARAAQQIMETWFAKFAAGTRLDGTESKLMRNFTVVACHKVFSGEYARHLGCQGLAPAYWIEPSPIIGSKQAARDSPACNVISTDPSSPTVLPMFGEGARYDLIGTRMHVSGVWATPRRSGWAYLYTPNAHSQNGSGEISVRASQNPTGREYSSGPLCESALFPGDNTEAVDDTLARVSWVVGDSGIAPPQMMAAVEKTGVVLQYEVPQITMDPADAVVYSRLPIRDCTVEVVAGSVGPSEYSGRDCGYRSFAGNRGMRAAARGALSTDAGWYSAG